MKYIRLHSEMCRDLCLQATLHVSVLLWVLCSTSHLKWEVAFLAAICPPLATHRDKERNNVA